MNSHFIRKFSREFSNIESLVDAAILNDLVKKENRAFIIERLKYTYEDGYFLDPTAIKFNEDGSIEIPKSLRAFKGILKQWIKEREYLTGESKTPNQTKLNAPVIAAFCNMVEDAGIIKQDFLSNGDFCKTVCENFGLKYTDRVRQNYPQEPTRKLKEKVKTLIVPDLPGEVKKVIETKINNETKLYG